MMLGFLKLSRGDRAFIWLRDRRELFNISGVEKACGIGRTTLLNAINKGQDSFRDSDRLAALLDQKFEGWDDGHTTN